MTFLSNEVVEGGVEQGARQVETTQGMFVLMLTGLIRPSAVSVKGVQQLNPCHITA